jgi:hypothetical protein
MSDELLDKDRRRGWRATSYVTTEEAELLLSRFDDEHEVAVIDLAAWAALGFKANRPGKQ